MFLPYIRLCLVGFCIGISCTLFGQVSFHSTENIISTEGYRSGITSAIVDVNNDGRDDIVRVTSRGILEVHLSSSNQEELYKIEYEASIPDVPWNITVGNLDNDGPNEIALGTVYQGGYIFSLNERNERLELNQVTAKDFYSQGANFTDINNDGFVDWFVNDDEAVNEIFLNDSTGHFVEADDFIDMSTAEPSDNSGNYSTDWVDIDGDGDMDFYLSKCRSTALSSNDPRRINQLFINDGANNYTEKAAQFGLAFGAQTWASNFGDLDNDGDVDAIVINHIDKWNLLENIKNDTFVERNNRIDTPGGRANQCLLRDFDNNGYLDILVAGENDYLWFNQGNWEFVLESKPFEYFTAVNFSVGDINHDGFHDIYTAYTNNFNDPGKVDDVLYLNAKNDNNWIAFNLVGTSSNRSGIGAKIKLHSESIGSQLRDVRSGESYGIMNSLNSIFGLGSDNQVDSIEVIWPSGQIDIYSDLDAGSYYTITEGTCITQEAKISATNNGYVCSDQSIRMSAPEGLSYAWSTGAETPEIETTRWGYYHVATTDDDCEVPVSGYVAKPQNNSDYRDLIKQLDVPFCAGTGVRLTAPDAKSYLWSNGDENQTTTVAKSGTYSILLEDFCGNEYQEELAINFQDASPTVLGDTVIIAPGETPRDAILKADGSKLKWYLTAEEDKAVFEGDTLVVADLAETTTYYVTGETTQSFSPEKIGEENWIGTNKYSARTANGGMFFHVREASTIQTIDVSTDSVGVRTIQIFNSDRDLLFEQTYDLKVGDTTLVLDVNLDEGIDYFITTSNDQNLETFGFKGPQLIRNNQGTRYPYKDSDLIWITNSSFGADYYLYFYNWKVKRNDLVCVSERVPVTAVLEVKSSTIEKYLGHFQVYPNPTNSMLTIESKEGKVLDKITVFDILGRSVLKEPATKTTLQEIDLSSLSNGQYCIKLTTTDNLSYAYRIIKQE